MAQTRKYANLPDLDSAPDVYETPGLTDDTTQASATERSISGESSYDEDSEGDESGVDRRRLRTDDARRRFGSSRVDAHKADFSDRIRRKKGSYRTATRVIRKHTGYPSDDEDDSDEESLQRRLRRLRQEIEEVKAECEQLGEERLTDDQNVDVASEIAKLSEMLDSVYTQQGMKPSTAEAQLANVLGRPFAPTVPRAGDSDAKPAVEQSRSVATAQYDRNLTEILAKAAEFDGRLAQLEQTLGVPSSAAHDTLPDVPILQLIETLDKQLATVAASPATYETAARRLQDLQRQRKEQAIEDVAVASPDPSRAYLDDPAHADAITALHAALPAIESMAPTLPLVVERLRSLRIVHASAGDVSATLDEMRARQREQEAEIAAWRAALEKVKAALKDGEGVLKENMDVVSGWVKDLEARMQKLS